MSKTFTEPKRISDVVKFEELLYSRDDIIISASGTLSVGTVLGKTTTGIYKQLAPAASDGTQVASAICLKRQNNGESIGLMRFAIVANGELVWPEGITDEQKTTALGELSAIGIITRKEA